MAEGSAAPPSVTTSANLTPKHAADEDSHRQTHEAGPGSQRRFTRLYRRAVNRRCRVRPHFGNTDSPSPALQPRKHAAIRTFPTGCQALSLRRGVSIRQGLVCSSGGLLTTVDP